MPTIYPDVSIFSATALTVSGGATPSATSEAVRATHGVPDAMSWEITASSGNPDVSFTYATSTDNVTYSTFIAAFGAAGAVSGGDFGNTSGAHNRVTVALTPADFYKFKVTTDDASHTMIVTARVRLAEDI